MKKCNNTSANVLSWWRRAKMHSSHAFLQSCSFVIVHFYIVQKCLWTIAFSLKSIWGMGHVYAIALGNLIHLCNSQGVRPVIQLLVCSKWNRFKSEKIHLYFKNAKQICMIAFQVQICKNAFLSIFAEHHAFCSVHFAAVHFCPIWHYLLSHRACVCPMEGVFMSYGIYIFLSYAQGSVCMSFGMDIFITMYMFYTFDGWY